MEDWLQSKLDQITREFLAGDGTGLLFEAQYLAYLECLLMYAHGTPQAEHLWVSWQACCAQNTPSGMKVRCLSHHVMDRPKLAQHLDQIRRQSQGPKALNIPCAILDERMDLFDLLSGT
jgi:hypothetical protein